MVGKTISHYKITKKLGEGGMGQVYLADDTKLKRQVAIKFLPEHLTKDKENVERFEREAEAAAALNHPNIVTIHEIAEHDDQTFIVMEHVDGDSLRTKIDKGISDIDEILNITNQICEGLSEAHKADIVHRDIKPENILIDNRGRVKILDFGLAKLKGVSKLTKETSTLGTIHYMSPEQLQGKEVDHRSDIWSLGVVIYELLTGEVPFQGSYEQAVTYAILNEEPKSTALFKKEVSSILEVLSRKALQKIADDRYKNVDELLTELNQIRSNLNNYKSDKKSPSKIRSFFNHKFAIITTITILAVTIILLIYSNITDHPVEISPLKRLVVLPFENLGSIDDEYFADGMTEEITSRLSLLHGLGVISRSSAIQYKNTDKTIRQIGEELDVQYILEGTVRWDKSVGTKGRVIVTPRLIRVSDNIHLWSDSYDRLLENIFDVQIKIAEEVIKALDITVLEPEREELYHHPTENLEAYELFIRAREIMLKYWTDQPKLEQAVQLFEQAIEKDKNLVMAYVWLSEIHSWLYHIQFDYTEDRQAKSKTAIDKALEMQPDLPEAKLYLGWYYYRVFRDYDRARELFNYVKKRRPNEAPRLLAAIERRQGNFENSVLHFEEAFQLDPRRPRMAVEVGMTYMSMRGYKKAEYWYKRNQLLVPTDDGSKGQLAKLYILSNGNINAAQSTLNSIKKIDIDSRSALEILILVDLLNKNYNSALNRFDSLGIGYISDQHFFLDKFCVKAYIYHLLSDTIKSRQCADSSMMTINQKMKENPNDPRYHSALGLAHAFQGKKNEAILAAKRAIEIYPISLDAMDGPNYVYNLAWIYTIIGEYDKAINQLEYLLSIPAGRFVSKVMLRIDPKWNKLRDNPRFQELIK